MRGTGASWCLKLLLSCIGSGTSLQIRPSGTVRSRLYGPLKINGTVLHSVMRVNNFQREGHMKCFVISIDWYGPYDRMSMHNAALSEKSYAGLYLARGSWQMRSPEIQYIGMSRSDLPWRIRWPNPGLDQVKKAEMWGGLISYHNAPVNALSGTSDAYGNTIKKAESIFIYLLQPRFNINEKTIAPKEPAIIINRWYDGAEPYKRRLSPDVVVPDFVEYDPESGATLAWHDDPPRIERMSPEEVKTLGIGGTGAD